MEPHTANLTFTHPVSGIPANSYKSAHDMIPLAATATAHLGLDTILNQLIKTGKADEALKVLEKEYTQFSSPRLDERRLRLRRALLILRTMAPDEFAAGENTSIIALKCALKIIAARRAAPTQSNRLGSIVFITGHLGAGGAEHQMTRTAEMLACAVGAKQTVAAVKMGGPLHVVVKSLVGDAHRTLDFFLPRLVRMNIPVWSMDDMPQSEAENISLKDKDLEALLTIVHPSIRRGLCLVPWFKQHRIDVAYIWQDNPILHFAMAALLAGVPRLVLNFRSMPPLLRWHEHLDEYRHLYSALALIPGVTFVTNSSIAADAYAKWAACPRQKFHVVANGASSHAQHPNRAEIEAWSNFENRTKAASVTIGGIFRMHPNKRPLEWIRFARRYLDTHPHARFILIGTGMLSAAVRELATELGIMPRLLLVRQTQAGAFWLRQMDAFVLLSRFEGTPNVLIEAQLSGIPVVCTPVANAKDTFMEGITGLTTTCFERLDIEEVVAKVDRVLTFSRAGSAMSDHAKRHTTSRFSNRSMFEHTVKVLSGHDFHCCVRQ